MSNYVYKEIGTCKKCGKRFAHEKTNQVYCQTCAQEEKGSMLKCPQCGKMFFPHHTRQVYCEFACTKKAANDRSNERNKDLYKQRTQEKKENAKKQQQKIANWTEITRICKENGCTYGQAVARGLI